MGIGDYGDYHLIIRLAKGEGISYTYPLENCLKTMKRLKEDYGDDVEFKLEPCKSKLF